MRWITLLGLWVLVSAAGAGDGPSRVELSKHGTVRVNGRPFFPVGVFTYSLDGTVLEETHEQQFNAVGCSMSHVAATRNSPAAMITTGTRPSPASAHSQGVMLSSSFARRLRHRRVRRLNRVFMPSSPNGCRAAGCLLPLCIRAASSGLAVVGRLSRPLLRGASAGGPAQRNRNWALCG